jgi:hypothetical protein
MTFQVPPQVPPASRPLLARGANLASEPCMRSCCVIGGARRQATSPATTRLERDFQSPKSGGRGALFRWFVPSGGPHRNSNPCLVTVAFSPVVSHSSQ